MSTTLDITTLVVGQMATNCYIVHDRNTKQALIIDPGDDAEYITDTIIKLNLTPIAILATHGHFDHVMAAFALQIAFGIPFMINPADTFLLKRMQETARHFLGVQAIDPPPRVDTALLDSQQLAVGDCLCTLWLGPGHTPGSMVLYHADSNSVFVGDILFADGAVGSTDHTYSSSADLKASIAKIRSLPENTTIYPGHGDTTMVKSL